MMSEEDTSDESSLRVDEDLPEDVGPDELLFDTWQRIALLEVRDDRSLAHREIALERLGKVIVSETEYTQEDLQEFHIRQQMEMSAYWTNDPGDSD